MTPVTVHILNITPTRKAPSRWLSRSISFFAGLVFLLACALVFL